MGCVFGRGLPYQSVCPSSYSFIIVHELLDLVLGALDGFPVARGAVLVLVHVSTVPDPQAEQDDCALIAVEPVQPFAE